MVKDPRVSLCVVSLGPICIHQLSYIELKSSIYKQCKTLSHRRSERSGGAGQVHCLSLLASFNIRYCLLNIFLSLLGCCGQVILGIGLEKRRRSERSGAE